MISFSESLDSKSSTDSSSAAFFWEVKLSKADFVVVKITKKLLSVIPNSSTTCKLSKILPE